MTRALVSALLCGLAVLITSCGGGSERPVPQGLQAAAARAQAIGTPQAAQAVDAAALMDWIEGAFPTFFPGHQASLTSGTIVFRFYPATQNYLAVVADQVYVLGAITANNVVRIGALSDFSCRVYPGNCAGSVSGVAANGAAIAGAAVTLKDSTNRTATATTSVSGSYTVATTGLTPPYLLQVVTGSGARLYSVNADTGSAALVNITPLTDLIVRSWYGVQGGSADTAFANPVASPAPSPQQVQVVAQTVLSVMQLALNSSGAGITAAADLISGVFVANRSGLDEVLDRTRITYGTGTATVVVTGTGTVQTTSLVYNPASATISAASTVVGGASTSSSSINAVVPVQTAQVTALSEISTLMNSLAAIVNAQGTSLTVSQVTGLMDPALLDKGLNRAQFAAGVVSSLNRGQVVAFTAVQLKQLDPAAGLAEVVFNLVQTQAGQTASSTSVFFFRKVGTAWMLSGDQRLAEVSLTAEAVRELGTGNARNGPRITAAVKAPQGTVSGAAVSSSAGNIALAQSSTVVDASGALLDSFFGSTDPAAGAYPVAGTSYAFALTRANAAALSYSLPLNAFTSELVQITSPASSALAAASLGGTLTVRWTLPATFAVGSVQLSALSFTSLQSGSSTLRCETEASAVLGVTSTSATLSIPATCSGQPVVLVNLNLAVNGVNGERTAVVYSMR
ncbi:MAG: hypothetical protein HYX47_04260 [Burkholderiales bacterium]|nr:hypothetical protein [Burkholderiales bacterium]